MKERLKSFRTTISTVMYMMDFVWHKKYGKTLFVVKYLYAAINAIMSSVIIVLPGLLINAITASAGMNKVILLLAAVLLLPLLRNLNNILFDKIISDINMKLELTMSIDYYRHISSMDYDTLENPDIQLLQERAEQTLNNTISVIDKTGNLLSAIISLGAIASIISLLNPLIIVLICLIIFVNSLMANKTNAKSFELGKLLNKIYRAQSFYPFALTNLDYAKEIRVFNLREYLIGLYSKSVDESNEVLKKRMKNSRKLTLFNTVTAFVQELAVYAYCIYDVICKGLPIGTMTIYLSATSQFSSALNNVFQSYLAFSYDSLAVQDMIKFFEIPLKQYETGNKTPVFNRDSIIEFRNVSFKYPGNEYYALKNFNLTIHGDEKLCIVGVNGSGKSTFIKLLMRLYFPESGEIRLNGVNIMEYDYEKYMRLFAPVFQDFATYELTLRQNIVLSELCDDDKLKKVCHNSGIDVLAKKTSKGYDVRLDRDKEEDSIQLSGGESQRMAISRACYHGGDIFILDEPTAALDPKAEYEIYTQFSNIITDKCAILITHRLSAVQLADNVAVFDDGHVAEYGTHSELYAKGGIYTEMFDKQAKFYRDEPEQ